MTFLIDGYNLMHAIGYLGQRVPRGKLEGARVRFLDWLASAARHRQAILRVVFDAQSVPRASPETEHKGVRVLFANGRTADDVIEDLLAGDNSRVTVVSNDTRIQAAGHRRNAIVQTCEEFVDWLIEEVKESTPPPVQPDKPGQSASEDEMNAWLKVFSTRKKK